MSTTDARPTQPAATPSETAAPAKARRRPKVVHLYWIHQARLAEAVGLPTPYLCGRVAKRPTGPSMERRIEVVGGLMLVVEARDCRQCVAVRERDLAKEGPRADEGGR